MNDVVGYLTVCLVNGTLFFSACALAVVPLLAWCAIRALEPQIIGLSNEVRWQAPLAAIAAALPGALFLMFTSVLIVTSVHSACLSYVAGRIFFGVIAVMTVSALLRAAFLASKRGLEVRRFVASARPPGSRLARIAGEIGVTARELPVETGTCFLAGILRPIVIVSAGALRKLDDDGLRAVLLHERGHARCGDQFLAAILSLCVDVLPLPVDRLIRTYRNSRELAADRHAVRESAPHCLAEAILLVARNQPQSVAALGGGELRLRIQALFAPPSESKNVFRRYLIVTALAIVFSFGVAPAVAIALGAASCATLMASE